MNVSMEKTGNVSAVLTVSIEENDYKEKVEKELKEIGKRQTIPGFRKGHVPFGELKRRFGKPVASDVINNEVYNAVIEYLRENKIGVLGEPIPVEVKELDLNNQKDFTFQYELALVPELEVKLDKDINVPYYTIEVTDEMVEQQDKNFRERFGAQVPGEEFEHNALVKGAIMELNEDGTVKTTDDAIQMINGIVAPMYFKDQDEAKKFEGKKVNDKVVFNPWKTCEGNPAELSSMLGIDSAKAADVKGDFEISISEIIVLRPAEVNQELFDNVFGKDKVTIEEDYRKGIKELIAGELEKNSEMLFRADFHKKMMDLYGNIELPAEQLKKWLIRREDKLNEENIDAEYEKMVPSLKWQLIKERLGEICELKIEEQDLINYAKMMARSQFAQYGMTNIDDETLADYAKRILADKNFRPRVVEEVGDAKMFDAAKEKITLNKEEVSLDKFKEIASQER